jgi:hypothetical protein
MNDIYKKIWKLAKPYYEKGRSYDISHIGWMMKEADQLADEELLDRRLLLPIVILHDVGYSEVDEKNPNIKSKDSKTMHMKVGAKISRAILNQVNYDPNLAEKIVHYISVHDNWLFGDDSPYQECKEMAAFNDLDFLWPTTSFEMFKTMAESMGKTSEEFYDFWIQDEKLERRPFCCDRTRKMWDSSIKEIKRILYGGQN